MNTIFKNPRYILLIFFGLGLSLISVNSAQANFIAGPATGGIEIVCAVPSLCGSNIGKLQLAGVRGLIGISVLSQPFNFVVSNGAGGTSNLTFNGNVLVGSSLTYTPSGVASGSWWLSGGPYDTPPMNGERYRLRKDGGSHPLNSGVPGVAVFPPTNSSPLSITSSSNVSCNGLVCTANNTGPASITVVFPAGQARAEAFPKYPDQDINCGIRSGSKDCGTDIKNITYGQQTTTISFTVYESSNRPSVTYKDTINIGTNKATAGWNYSDSDGDKQTESQLRLYKDAARTELDRETITQSGESTSININGLQPGTTYYPSVRARNNPDGWTDWINGPGFTTQTNDDPNPTNIPGCSVNTSVLSWSYTSEPSEPISLVIRYRQVSDELWNTSEISSDNTNFYISSLDLDKGTEYEFQIRFQSSSISEPCGNITIPVDISISDRPSVSCSIKDNKKAVSASDSTITLIIRVTNIDNYTWDIKNGAEKINNDSDLDYSFNIKSPSENRSSFDEVINYGSVPFGRYTPSVTVGIPGTEEKLVAQCGTISNFGRTQIKETSS
jgi:hypothetical protein